MKELAKITKDNCDFPTLRQSGCIYVDKTAWLVKLATDVQSRMYFLARPRRFGKSLMISTLRAMFEGRKELFKGLAIMKTKWDWKKKHPVIHLNMGLCAAGKRGEGRAGRLRPRIVPSEGNALPDGISHDRQI